LNKALAGASEIFVVGLNFDFIFSIKPKIQTISAMPVSAK
jgi:hypothetical protein